MITILLNRLKESAMYSLEEDFNWDHHKITPTDVKQYISDGKSGTSEPYGDTWKHMPDETKSKEYHISRVAYFVQHPEEIKGIEIDNKCDGFYIIYPIPVIVDGWHRIMAAHILGLEKIKVVYSGRKDVEDYLKGRRKTQPTKLI